MSPFFARSHGRGASLPLASKMINLDFGPLSSGATNMTRAVIVFLETCQACPRPDEDAAPRGGSWSWSLSGGRPRRRLHRARVAGVALLSRASHQGRTQPAPCLFPSPSPWAWRRPAVAAAGTVFASIPAPRPDQAPAGRFRRRESDQRNHRPLVCLREIQ